MSDKIENQWTLTPDCNPGATQGTQDVTFITTMRLRELCLQMALELPNNQDEIGKLFKRLIEINEHDDFMMGL